MKNTNHTDLSYLKGMSGGNNDLIVEMIDIYKSQIPEFVEDFNKHLADTNWDGIAAVAHKAKSSVAIMGIASLAAELKEMEINAKSKSDIGLIEKYIQNFTLVTAESIIELDEAVKNL